MTEHELGKLLPFFLYFQQQYEYLNISYEFQKYLLELHQLDKSYNLQKHFPRQYQFFHQLNLSNLYFLKNHRLLKNVY